MKDSHKMPKTNLKQPELDDPAYRIIFESALEGIIAVNKRGKIVFANPQAEKMFGYAEGELTGKSHDILVPSGSRKLHHDQLARYISKPVPRLMGSGLELVGKRKDGSAFPVDINLIPLDIEPGLIVISVIRDVTEQKQTEKLLRDESDRYRTVAEASQDHIFILTTDEIIEYVNSFAAAEFGMSPDELRGKSLTALFPPDVYKSQHQSLQKVLKEGKPISDEIKIAFPHGELWLNVRLVPLRDKEGVINFILSVARDITEHKRAEEKLLEEKQRLETVTGFTNCALFLLDNESRVIYANKIAQKWFGSMDKIGGRLCWEVFALTHPETECAGLEVLRTGKAVRRETYAKLSGLSEERYVFLDASPIKDSAGNVQQLIELVVDITEHKKTEERLRAKSRELIRQHKITSDFMNILEITSTSMNFNASLNRLIPFINGLLENDACMVYAVDTKNSVIQPSHQFGLPKSSLIYFSASTLSYDGSKLPAVAYYRDAKFVANLNDAIADLPESLQSLLKLIKAKSLFIIPISYEGQTVAILICAYLKKRILGRTQVEIALKLQKHLEYFCSAHKQTLSLLQETMELTKHVEVVEAMSGIDLAILGSSTEEEMIQAALMRLGKVVKSKIIQILRYDATKETFKLNSGLEENRIVFETRNHDRDHMKSWNALAFGIPAYYPNLAKEPAAKDYERNFLDKGMNSLLIMPLLVKDELVGLISFADQSTAAYSPKDLAIAQRLSNQIAIALLNAGLIKQLQDMLIGVVKSLITAIDAKSPWTKGHSERVSEIAVEIGEYLALNENDLYELKLAALFHDAGKIGTYEGVLEKKGKLAKTEVDSMRRHPEKTYEIVFHIPKMRRIAEIALHHHERWDGTGYPDGLAGENIPYLSRIIAVADTYDALISDRPYRKGFGPEQALEEIKRNAGAQFDPEIAEIFIDNFSRETKNTIKRRKRAQRTPKAA